MHGPEYGNGISSEQSSGFVTGLLCGAAVGAAIGLLLAPRSGAELSDDVELAAGLNGCVRRAATPTASASETVGRVVDQSRRAAEAGRARVEDAVNEGRGRVRRTGQRRAIGGDSDGI